MFLKRYVIYTFMQLVCDTCEADSLKASTGEKRGNDVRQWVVPSMQYQKLARFLVSR